LTVTQDENHVPDEDTEDTEDQGHVMGQVQHSAALDEEKETHESPYGSVQI